METRLNGKPTSSFRVLIYSRVSSPRQAQYGHSLEAQPEDLEAWAEAQGWRVAGKLTDSGRTGRTADRVGLNELMQALRVQRPDAVVGTRLSRFMRNARLTLNAVHQMREMNVALICKDEPIDTRQRGISDMFLAILATLAEWESDRLSEYAKETRQRLIAKGRLPSGRPPYGYRYDKESAALVVDEDKAGTVRLIYSLYTDQRLGMHAITRELAGRAIPSPNGNRVWNSNVLQKILSNPTYIGRHPLDVNTQPIIHAPVFDRAQVLRKTNKQLHPPRKDPWALQGRLKWMTCGSTLQCEYARGHRYYRCPGRTTRSKYYLETGKRCALAGLRAEEVEEQLLIAVFDAMLKPDNFARALERTIKELETRVGDLEKEAAPLERALGEVEEELRKIERAWIRGRLSQEELRGMERDAEARRERTQARLDALDFGDLEELARTRRLIGAAERSLEMASTADEGWWSHPESPPMWFTDVLTPPGWSEDESAHKGALQAGVYDTFPPLDPDYIARTLNEALNRLQAQVWANPGGLEMRGIISLNLPPSEGDGVPFPGVLLKPDKGHDSQALGVASSGSPRT